MKTINALRLSLVGFACLIAASAQAQDSAYYYGGLSIGQSQATIDEDRISAGLLAKGLSTSSMSRDERDMTFKAFGGYQFNRHFAVEAGLFRLGEFGFTSNTSPAGSLTGRMRVQGLNLDLVGTLPLTERLSAIGRIGAQGAWTHSTFSSTGAVAVANENARKRQINYKVGAGLQYEVSPAMFVRGEVERYRINDAVGRRGDVDAVSLSLVFPIGRAPAAAPAPPPVAAAPAYVAPEPAPVVAVAAAPVAPPVAVAPVRRHVSFSADSLYSFDTAEIRPQGKVELDKLAKDLDGTQFDVITVVGHADRLGSPAYNQKLSVQRAEAVKTYLSASGGIDAMKISASGKGESEPVTQADTCKGHKRTAKLIACLQADRRVEVEVTGVR